MKTAVSLDSSFLAFIYSFVRMLTGYTRNLIDEANLSVSDELLCADQTIFRLLAIHANDANFSLFVIKSQRLRKAVLSIYAEAMRLSGRTGNSAQ